MVPRTLLVVLTKHRKEQLKEELPDSVEFPFDTVQEAWLRQLWPVHSCPMNQYRLDLEVGATFKTIPSNVVCM